MFLVKAAACIKHLAFIVIFFFLNITFSNWVNKFLSCICQTNLLFKHNQPYGSNLCRIKAFKSRSLELRDFWYTSAYCDFGMYFANNAVRFILLTVLFICIQYKLLHISRPSKQNFCNQKSTIRIPNCVESYSIFDKHLSAEVPFSQCGK